MATRSGSVAVNVYKCRKCGHEWAGRPAATGGREPSICPKCKNPDWRNERVRKAHRKGRKAAD
jgi:predicted Zn-ribbon and HTH transcriptional regulator